MCFIFWKSNIWRIAFDLEMILNHNSIVYHSNVGGGGQFTFFIEYGCPVDDIIGLPLSRSLACIHQRHTLFVNAGSLPVGVRTVIVGIQHLYFIDSLKKYAAIAPALTFPFNQLIQALKPSSVLAEICKTGISG